GARHDERPARGAFRLGMLRFRPVLPVRKGSGTGRPEGVASPPTGRSRNSMLTWLAKKLFGTSNERALKRIQPLVVAINGLEDGLKRLSDAELQAKTGEFKQKLDNGATLDDILVEAFAVCREASRRVLKMRHYDVQLIGGVVLHRGSIAEMRTGEGKTLVATLPVYLNALEGKGVHLRSEERR